MNNNITSSTGSFIVPAIDIINGKVVRLTHGDYASEKTYYENPLDAALQFEAAGLQRLHLVDLDGAKAGKIQHLKILERIAAATSLQVDFGGGVKEEADVKNILNAGASMVTIGSLAVKQPALLEAWIQSYGADKFFIGADVLNNQIKISGWLQDGGIDIFSFIENMMQIGITRFFCTDINKDGAMQGASVVLYKEIIGRFPGINLTASGGVSSIDDIEALKKVGCAAAIVGKAIYENAISLEALKQLND